MKADEHPVYRAKFYIPELKKSVSWKEYLDYYRDLDEQFWLYSYYCSQMWASYMDDKCKRREAPLSYREYVDKYTKLLEEGFNDRPKD